MGSGSHCVHYVAMLNKVHLSSLSAPPSGSNMPLTQGCVQNTHNETVKKGNCVCVCEITEVSSLFSVTPCTHCSGLSLTLADAFHPLCYFQNKREIWVENALSRTEVSVTNWLN